MYYSSCEFLDDIISFFCQMVKKRKKKVQRQEFGQVVTMITLEREVHGSRPALPKLSKFTHRKVCH